MRRRHFLHRWRQGLIGNYWLLPGLLALLAIVSAGLLLSLDAWLGSTLWTAEDFPLRTTAASASTVLSIIAGSAISVAGVVFSITIVVLNMAAAQFGPRLLPSFMEQRATQLVLGIFLAAFVYSMVVLSFVRSGNEAFVPQVSIGLGIGIGIASFLTLIWFIHHVAAFIQASRVIDSVSRRMGESMRGAFPPEDTEPGQPDKEEHEETPADQADALQLRSASSGYLQRIDYSRVLDLAAEHSLFVKLHWRPGHFVMAGETLMSAWPRAGVDDSTAAALHETCRLGPARIAAQDPEFAVHQLVEIALRALSPGINDPYTALNCVDRLGGMLAELSARRLPSRYLNDESGHRRVATAAFTYSGIVDAAFDQLRQQADGNAAVVFRILEIFERLGRRRLPAAFREALARQCDAVIGLSADDFPSPLDRAQFEERAAAARAAMRAR